MGDFLLEEGKIELEDIFSGKEPDQGSQCQVGPEPQGTGFPFLDPADNGVEEESQETSQKHGKASSPYSGKGTYHACHFHISPAQGFSFEKFFPGNGANGQYSPQGHHGKEGKKEVLDSSGEEQGSQ